MQCCFAEQPGGSRWSLLVSETRATAPITAAPVSSPTVSQHPVGSSQVVFVAGAPLQLLPRLWGPGATMGQAL